MQGIFRLRCSNWFYRYEKEKLFSPAVQYDEDVTYKVPALPLDFIFHIHYLHCWNYLLYQELPIYQYGYA